MTVGTPYKRFKFESTYDTIVIGSGIGGLTTAALLAKHKHERVLVLERHYTAGGFTHSFTRRGFEWDVGIHYLGELGPGMRMRKLFDHLSDGKLLWADMGEVYDTIYIADRRYDLVRGKEAFRRQLKAYFPDEGDAIDAYLEQIAKAAESLQGFMTEKALPRLLQRVVGGLMRRPALRYARRTTAEVLAELTDNAELRAVLSAQWGDYGLPPSEGSFLMHAIVVSHYLEGACYPVGGAARIAEAIAPAIEQAGGALLVRAEVSEILLDKDRAVGVRMADGRELRARKIVSDAGAAITYGRLLPEPARARTDISGVLERIAPSGAHLSLYIGLDRTAAELGLEKRNRWLYPGPDHDANVRAFVADRNAAMPVVYLSFPSAKDPDFERRYPGRATIEAITLAPYAWFERWQAEPWGRRSEDYEALKEQLKERLLAAVTEQCPSVQGHIVHAELSTPLSTRHFAGHPHGEIYGLAHTPARFEERALQPATPFRGLYLCGADAATAGVGGALAGGIVAASAILGRNMFALASRGHDPGPAASHPAHA